MCVVFRVEDKDGTGPFQGEFYHCMNGSLPTIDCDLEFRKILENSGMSMESIHRGVYIHKYRGKKEFNSDQIYGCSSLECLADWIDFDYTQQLEYAGFAVSVYRAVPEWVLHGSFQVLFDYASAELINRFSIDCMKNYRGNYSKLLDVLEIDI